MATESSQLKIGVILNYANMAVGNLIPLLYTPIMLALLGQNEYGLYKLSSSATGYLSLVSLGIGSALTRFLIKAKTEGGQQAEERVLGLFVRIFQAISALCVILGIILTLSLGFWYGDALNDTELSRMKVLSLIMIANMALSFMMAPYVSLVTTHERFIFLQSMHILLTTIVPILNLVVLYFGFASIGMAVSSLIVNVAARIVYYMYVRRIMKIQARTNEAPYNMIKDIFHFSIWIFVGEIVGKLYNTTDVLLIGMIPSLATIGVAIYSVGTVFNRIVFGLSTGISSLIAPRVNKMVFEKASDTEITDFTIRIGRIQGYMFALFASGFICFGRPFIHYYVGDEYQDAYWVTLLMLIPHGIPLVQSACLNVVIAKNQHKFRSIVYLLIAILNVIGTWILLPIMGIIGAALMTGIALIIGQGFVMNWFYKYRSGIQIGKFWNQVGRVYALPAIQCTLTLFLSFYIDFYNIIYFILGVILYALTFALLQYKCIMNDYEKNLITQPLIRLFHKG